MKALGGQFFAGVHNVHGRVGSDVRELSLKLFRGTGKQGQYFRAVVDRDDVSDA